MARIYRIGIDVGGTFTDLVAIDQDGSTVFTKSPSTPQDQSIGVMTGLAELAARLDLAPAELLNQASDIVHGTTVATNALLERKGALVGLLTTAGHRDVLEMREGLKPERYNLLLPPPEPLVPRNLRRGVRERIGYDGSVLTRLDEESLLREIDVLAEAGVTSIAVCYLHAYRNPEHELRTREVVSRRLPDAYVSLSSEVLPQIKEYERVCTTVVNSYIGPPVRNYLRRLEARLAEAGFAGRLSIILSHGGLASVEEASRLAAGTVLSGPAGGIAGSQRCADLLKLGDLVPFDMGGTSTDISLISGGQAALTSERGLADQRIALRSFDIVSIASGGGSIARVDQGGNFDVGPESAGSMPGPACYGNGGTLPTVTDANLLLGYLDADDFLGGRRKLDTEASRRAVAGLGQLLGLSTDEAAAGIYRLINVKMADGIRLMTLRRGVDPRGHALLSFGGAAGLHAVEVAREMEMSRVVVPTVASVLSAWGMLASDMRYETSRSYLADMDRLSAGELRRIFEEMMAQGRLRLGAWPPERLRFELSADMRYGEQIYEVQVSLDGLDIASGSLIDALKQRFHRRHEELYTYASPDQEVVLVNVRAAAIGEVLRPGVGESRPAAGAAGAPAGRRRALIGRWRDVPVHRHAELSVGQRIAGPSIIVAETTTVVVGERDTAFVEGNGWLTIDVAPAASATLGQLNRAVA